LLILLGFQRAGNSLERVLDGARRHWWSVGAWLLVALGGGAGGSGIIVYWLGVYCRC
jgi:hypothetical protein